MGMRRQAKGSGAARPERGAVLVEFAIVALLLFALIFGIVDFGNAYNDHISVRQGARDAARQAVTGQIAGVPSCTINGSPTTNSVRNVVCLAKNRTGLTSSTRVAIDVNDQDGTGPGRGSISVCVSHPLRSITGFFPMLDSKSVDSETQMRVEQTVAEAGGSTGVLEDFIETGFSGSCVAENTT